jgi:hypothetical protein
LPIIEHIMTCGGTANCSGFRQYLWGASKSRPCAGLVQTRRTQRDIHAHTAGAGPHSHRSCFTRKNCSEQSLLTSLLTCGVCGNFQHGGHIGTSDRDLAFMSWICAGLDGTVSTEGISSSRLKNKSSCIAACCSFRERNCACMHDAYVISDA